MKSGKRTRFFLTILSFAVLVACLGLAPTTMAAAPQKTISFWCQKWWPVGYNEGMVAAAKDFEKETGVKVDLFIAGDVEVRTKVQVAIETKTLPDVGFIMSAEPTMYHELGVLAPVTDVVNHLKKKYGGLYGDITCGKFGSQYYAVPYYSIPDVLHVRKDRFDQAGLALPQTWDEVMAAVKKTTDAAKNIYGFGEGVGAGNVDHGKLLRTLMYSFGGGEFAKNGKTITIGSPQSLKAFAWVKEGWKAVIFPPDGTQWDSSGNNKSWLSGQATMIWNAASTIVSTQSQAPDIYKNMAMVKVPAGPNGVRVQFSDVQNLVVFKTSKNVALAKKFIEFLFQPKYYSKWVMPSGQPTFQSFVSDPMWNDPLLKPVIETSQYIKNMGYPGPLTPWAAEMFQRNILEQMSSEMVLKNLTPEEAAKEYIPKIKEIMNRWQKK